MLDELIVSLPQPAQPRLSPDGRWVVWVAGPVGQGKEGRRSNLWIAPADGSAPATRFTGGEHADRRPRWSPDGQTIAFLSDRAARGTAGIWLIPRAGGEARSLHQRKRGIAHYEWSPDGGAIAFAAPDDPTPEDERRIEEGDDADVYGERWEMNRLRLIDVHSRAVRDLDAGEGHVTGLAWSPDGERLAVTVAPTPEIESARHTEIRAVSLGGGEVWRVCAAPGAEDGELAWSDDGALIVFVGRHDPLPQAAMTIMAVPASGGEPRVIGTRVDEPACSYQLTPVRGRGRILITVAEGLTTRVEQVELASGRRGRLFSPPRGDFRLGDAVISREAPDEPVMAMIKATGDEPPEVWAGPAGAPRRLSDHNAPLREFRFGEKEPIAWTAPDGLAMDGFIIRPARDGAPPWPTVVLVHGGPYGRWGDGWNLAPLDWGQWLAHHGYAVLLANYRGGMGRGHDFALRARGAVGRGDFQDVMAGVDAVVERGIADPRRLGIGGWSQGGFMTAWAVTQTNRFKAGVMGAGVSDWNMMVMTSDVPTFEATLGGSRPWDGLEATSSARLSPISYAGRAETPLLILHGKEDARVPVSQAIGFERALRERGVPVTLVTYPREPHGLRERAHQRDALRRVLDWYDRWLGRD